MSEQGRTPNYNSLVPLDDASFRYRIPAKPAWITLILCFLLSLLPANEISWSPDLVLLFLCFFCAHYTKGVGLLAAFVFGVFKDVQVLDLLGVGALHYILTVYGVEKMRGRIMHFNGFKQMIQLIPVFIMATIPSVFIHAWYNAAFNPTLFLKAFVTVCLWQILTMLYDALTNRLLDQKSL